MRHSRTTLSLIAVAVLAVGLLRQDARAGAAQLVLSLDGDVSPVHDPVVIREQGTYSVFCR